MYLTKTINFQYTTYIEFFFSFLAIFYEKSVFEAKKVFSTNCLQSLFKQFVGIFESSEQQIRVQKVKIISLYDFIQSFPLHTRSIACPWTVRKRFVNLRCRVGLEEKIKNKKSIHNLKLKKLQLTYPHSSKSQTVFTLRKVTKQNSFLLLYILIEK